MFYAPPNWREKRGRRSWKNSNEVFVSAVSFAAVLLLVIVVAVFLRSTREVKKGGETQTSAAPEPQVFNIVGRIAKIENSVLVVTSSLPEEVERRVIVSPATAIIKLDFVPEISGGQKRFVPQETTLSFSGLRVGWTIEALAAADVTRAEEFSAVRIRVLP